MEKGSGAAVVGRRRLGKSLTERRIKETDGARLG